MRKPANPHLFRQLNTLSQMVQSAIGGTGFTASAMIFASDLAV